MANKKKVTEEHGEKKVILNIPKTKQEKDDVFISVNNRTFQIKRGVNVEVPLSVAEVWQEHERAEALAFEYEEKMKIN